ncbi:MAG: hypothetical protein Fur005_38100 [Roseiflexaceae bacterium]
MALAILTTAQIAEWQQALRQIPHDFYFLPTYHALAEARGEGHARLFLYQQGEYTLALPLLLRPLDTITGMEQIGRGWWDATSVYGYTGPIASHTTIPEAVLHEFRVALSEALREQRVIAVFSRMHPLQPDQQTILRGLGEYQVRWQTVSIDLQRSPEAQVAAYRQGHRYEVRRLQKLGLNCERDEGFIHLAEFVDIYHETMRRVEATGSYFFDQAYFEYLRTMGNFHLWLGRLEGRIVCGALFSLCDRICQYHLAGTRNDSLRMAPMKLVIDQARQWAWQQGAHALHLGGGLGPQQDSLFQFKAGFSDQRHDFAIWRWILDSEPYERLTQQRNEIERQRGMRLASGEFFPRYRSPAIPLSEVLNESA